MKQNKWKILWGEFKNKLVKKEESMELDVDNLQGIGKRHQQEDSLCMSDYSDKKVLLVTHGGTSRAIEAYFKGTENGIMPPETLQNCEIREYEYID